MTPLFVWLRLSLVIRVCSSSCAKFQVQSAPDTCERSATQKCINLPDSFHPPGPQGGDRRGTNHHRRKKFFNSAVVKTVPLSCFEGGRWVQCLTQFGNFTPFE